MVEVHKPHYCGYAQSAQAGDCALAPRAVVYQLSANVDEYPNFPEPKFKLNPIKPNSTFCPTAVQAPEILSSSS